MPAPGRGPSAPRRPSATRSPTGRWTAGRSIGSTTSGGPTSAPLRRGLLVLGAGDRGRASRPATGCTTPASTWSASRRSTPSSSRRACATCATTAFRSSASSPPATPRASAAPRPTRSPTLDPEAFVDDYLPYMRGVPAHVHTALVLRAPNGSPNVGDELAAGTLDPPRPARLRRATGWRAERRYLRWLSSEVGGR